VNLYKPKILEKFVKRFSNKDINLAYQKFLSYQEKQKDIEKFKEIEYQEGFLRDIFVKVLGYTLKTDKPDNFSLVREAKNEYDNKKPDAIIWINKIPKAIIELKDLKTRDLTKPKSKNELDAVSQAFNYKTSFKNCSYVIVSNFKEIRLYMSSKLEYIGFDLFNLTETDFKYFFSLFSFEGIKNDYPKEYFESLKKDEKEITDKFYQELNDIRSEIINYLIKHYPNIDKNLIIEKTQKLFDRMIFIYFAEDKGLIPNNTVEIYIDEGSKFLSSKWNSIKKLFRDIDKGNQSLNINKFNGGLFAFDEIIDKIFDIPDELVDKLKQLSFYDFDSELTVNILGHIFEQSLNDLEQLKKTDNFNIKKTLRKKFGIFYTPEHITRFICEITIGKLCEEKKEKLDIAFIDLDRKINPNRLTKAQRKTLVNLYKYKKFLENLKILDPACGSGAFLNMAFDILQREYKYFDDMRKIFEGDALGLYDVDIKILENNLYGVDINSESVEIAKLSLWLKTATSDRQLSDLSGKIKQADTLKSNFNQLFPEVKDGFDVIIGNPPYVSYQSNLLSEEDIQYFKNTFETSYKIYDLYGLFIEKSINLLKENGEFAFICPSNFLQNESFSLLRKFVAEKTTINKVVFCSDGVFENAVVPTIILNFTKSNKKNKEVEIYKADNINIYPSLKIEYNDFIKEPKNGFNIDTNLEDKKIIQKIMKKKHFKIDDFLNIREAIKTGNDKYFISDIPDEIHTEKIVTGKEISRYKIDGYKYFYYAPDKLKRPVKKEYFKQEKIFIRRVGKRVEAAFDDKGLFATHVLYLGTLKSNNKKLSLKAIMAILNSSLYSYLYKKLYPFKGDIFPEIRIGKLRELPINKNLLKFKTELDYLANRIIELNKNIINKKNEFLEEASFEKLSKKIKQFYLLDYDEFIKELIKLNNIKLKSKLEKVKLKKEYETLFTTYKNEINNYLSEINQLDTKIDNIVFKSFNLSNEEIKLIKGQQ